MKHWIETNVDDIQRLIPRQLYTLISEAWEAVPETLIKNLMRSMSKRLWQVMEREGGGLIIERIKG